MEDMIALLQTNAPLISKTNLRQLRRAIFGMLAMTDRAIRLGVSGWADLKFARGLVMVMQVEPG
jgi:hypothetical protein